MRKSIKTEFEEKMAEIGNEEAIDKDLSNELEQKPEEKPKKEKTQKYTLNNDILFKINDRLNNLYAKLDDTSKNFNYLDKRVEAVESAKSTDSEKIQKLSERHLNIILGDLNKVANNISEVANLIKDETNKSVEYFKDIRDVTNLYGTAKALMLAHERIHQLNSSFTKIDSLLFTLKKNLDMLVEKVKRE